MIDLLKRIFQKQQFNPTFLGLWVNPFYHARRELYQTILKIAPKVEGRILDVGCGQKPYQHLFQSTEYVGLEIDSKENRANKLADYFYDGTIFPFSDQSFDTIVCNQVLEHVFTPEAFLAEAFRVLKPNGKLILTVPFVWDEHEQPWDYARYSSFGLKYLLEKKEFKVIEQHKTNADSRVLFQLINAYLFKVFQKSQPIYNLLILCNIHGTVQYFRFYTL